MDKTSTKDDTMKKLLTLLFCLIALSAQAQVRISNLTQASTALAADLIPFSNTARSTSSSYVMSVATISSYVWANPPSTVQLGAGSAAAPGLALGESNTGWYRSSAGTIDFSASGTRSLSMNSGTMYFQGGMSNLQMQGGATANIVLGSGTNTNISNIAANTVGIGSGAAGSTAGAIVANEVRSNSLVVTGSARVTSILSNAGVADNQVYIRDKIYGQYAGDGATTRGAISFSAGGDAVQLEGTSGARIRGATTTADLFGYFLTSSVGTFTIKPTAVDYGGGYISTGHTMVIAGGQGSAGGTGYQGGLLNLTGGAAAGSGSNKGGDVIISGGAPSGTAVTGGVSVAATGGVVSFSKTVTAVATTGDQTIHKVTGAVNFAAAATSLVVTNNLVNTSSVVLCSVGTNDTTMKSVACVPTANTITITANAAATAETRVNFMVTN